MRVQLVVTEEDLRGFLLSVTPARIELGREADVDRWIEIGPPEYLAVTEAKGLILRAPAKLRWNVAGINVPIAFRTVEITLDLSIDGPEGAVMKFRPQIVEADFVGLPAVIERGLIKLVNNSLAKSTLEWNFVETLQFSPHMSPKLQPPTVVDIRAKFGELTKSDGAITLSVTGVIEGRREQPAQTTGS